MRLKALKGLIPGKPPVAHHNQSSPLMSIYIPSSTLATGFLYSCPAHLSLLCRWRPGLCGSRQKWLTALSGTWLRGVSCIQGPWGSRRSSQRPEKKFSFQQNKKRCFKFIVTQSQKQKKKILKWNSYSFKDIMCNISALKCIILVPQLLYISQVVYFTTPNVSNNVHR